MANNVFIDDALDADLVLSKCQDFKEEVTIIERELWKTRDILVLSPKCHPEVAGCGVEYCIGYSKMRFRREFNDTLTQNLYSNVMKCLSNKCLSLEHVWKYARRARDYIHVYMQVQAKGGQLGRETKVNGETVIDMYVTSGWTHEILEDMRKKCSTHRNIFELERKYLENEHADSVPKVPSTKRNAIKF